ncbi:MAG TPA: TolC family protein, partial [Chitinophagaceae bacterium]|nr:TolC family protein [Chitinophagaceae bacterium]
MRKLFFFLFFCFPIMLVAQANDVLTYEEAVALTLKNNYDILIAKNDAEIAIVENNLGYAGFLPKLDINSGGSLANNRTKQEFSSGAGVNKSGVVSKNINAGAILSYTLFDGFKMFATKARLALLEEQGAMNLKI